MLFTQRKAVGVIVDQNGNRVLFFQYGFEGHFLPGWDVLCIVNDTHFEIHHTRDTDPNAVNILWLRPIDEPAEMVQDLLR